MSVEVDIRQLLESWPYDPDNDARLIRAQDGRELLQVRLPLGLEQYEASGRPDGLRPHGFESWLDYYQDRQRRAQAEGLTFSLDERQCRTLFDEGTLYYWRYLRWFQLKDWSRTIRDTERNLSLFDFVRRYAQRPEDQQHLEQWRPYILRMHGVASAMLKLEQGQYEEALDRLQKTLQAIEALDEMEVETFHFERRRSVTALRELLAQIEQIRPVSELERLERALREAVEKQEFERAAQLRDRLRALRAQRGGSR